MVLWEWWFPFCILILRKLSELNSLSSSKTWEYRRKPSFQSRNSWMDSEFHFFSVKKTGRQSLSLCLEFGETTAWRPHQTSLEKVVCSFISTSDGYFYLWGYLRSTCVCWGGVPPLWCRRSHLEDQLAMLEVWTQNGKQRMKIGVPVLGIPDSKRCPSYSQHQVLRILKGQWVNDSGAKLRSPFPLKFSICWIFFWDFGGTFWESGKIIFLF